MMKLQKLSEGEYRNSQVSRGPPLPHAVQWCDGTKKFHSGSGILLRKMPFVRINRHLPLLPPRILTHPRRRVCLAALRQLRPGNSACAAGLLDQLILPNCTEMMLEEEFAGETLAQDGSPAARIDGSSINHLPVTRGITNAVAMKNSCTFSGSQPLVAPGDPCVCVCVSIILRSARRPEQSPIYYREFGLSSTQLTLYKICRDDCTFECEEKKFESG